MSVFPLWLCWWLILLSVPVEDVVEKVVDEAVWNVCQALLLIPVKIEGTMSSFLVFLLELVNEDALE